MLPLVLPGIFPMIVFPDRLIIHKLPFKDAAIRIGHFSVAVSLAIHELTAQNMDGKIATNNTQLQQKLPPVTGGIPYYYITDMAE